MGRDYGALFLTSPDRSGTPLTMAQLLRRLIAIALLGTVIVVGVYVWNFGHLELSQEPEDWAQFGEYIGGSLGAFYAALAFGGVLITIRRQQVQSRRDSRTAREAARTARRSLDISRRTMIANGRAYVRHSGIRYFSHPLENGGLFWRLRPGWANVGNTPTRSLRVRVIFELRDTPYAVHFAFPVDYLPELGRSTLAPKDSLESPFLNITADELLLIKNGKKHLYAWGGAEYHDVFPDTPQRVTKFCVLADSVTGDPLRVFDDKTNPLEIRWGHVAGHNFMDPDL
jgi:hypothetical protein